MKKNDKRLYETFRSVNKNALIELLSKKTKGIEMKHLPPVVSILMETMLQNLIDGKEIVVSNFFTVKMYVVPSRKSRNYYTGEMGMTKPYNRFAFNIHPKLSKLIRTQTDLKKYFNDQE